MDSIPSISRTELKKYARQGIPTVRLYVDSDEYGDGLLAEVNGQFYIHFLFHPFHHPLRSGDEIGILQEDNERLERRRVKLGE